MVSEFIGRQKEITNFVGVYARKMGIWLLILRILRGGLMEIRCESNNLGRRCALSQASGGMLISYNDYEFMVFFNKA